MEHTTIHQALRDWMARPEEQSDLAYGALLIAKEEYPHLSLQTYLDQLDRWGALAKARMGSARNPHVLIERLNQVVFEVLGFRGNVEHQDDPRNRYLNAVMDRRLGIPLTLSIVYLEVGRRAGVSLVGVDFPGHFLVRCEDLGTPLIIDPFHHGAILTMARCQALARRLLGDRVMWNPRWLDGVSKKEILVRLLRDLKRVYADQGQWMKAMGVMERLLLLDADNGLEQEEYLAMYAQLTN